MTQPIDATHCNVADLQRPFACEALFDAIADTVFFVKDADGRYVAVNRTLVTRTGRRDKPDLIGLSAREVFPGALGEAIAVQDEAVIATGTPIAGRLELHLYADGSDGWCLTWKEPLRDAAGTIVGLTGISRDLQPLSMAPRDFAAIARIVDYIAAHIADPLPLAALANRAGMTEFQLDQRMRGLYGVSATQYQTRARLDHACLLLRQGTKPIAQIALACGYGDQAAFTRAFRRAVGLTPSQYQKR
jgi:PAS domain S-box-containing protein